MKRSIAYRQAVQFNPRDEWAWNNLGNAYKSVGRLAEAVNALREAIGLKPDWGEAYCNLGGAFISQGEIESATEVFERSVAKVASTSGGSLQPWSGAFAAGGL